jgi:hypothetical protein
VRRIRKLFFDPRNERARFFDGKGRRQRGNEARVDYRLLAADFGEGNKIGLGHKRDFTLRHGLQNKKRPSHKGLFMAGDQGFEPQTLRPERNVMPFHQSPKFFQRAIFYHAHSFTTREPAIFHGGLM